MWNKALIKLPTFKLGLGILVKANTSLVNPTENSDVSETDPSLAPLEAELLFGRARNALLMQSILLYEMLYRCFEKWAVERSM